MSKLGYCSNLSKMEYILTNGDIALLFDLNKRFVRKLSVTETMFIKDFIYVDAVSILISDYNCECALNLGGAFYKKEFSKDNVEFLVAFLNSLQGLVNVLIKEDMIKGVRYLQLFFVFKEQVLGLYKESIEEYLYE